MRIAFLTFEFPDVRPGGIGSYVCKCAASLAAAGHEAHLFTLTVPPHIKAGLPRNVFVHDVPDIAEQISSGTLPGPLGVTALNGELPIYKLAVAALLANALREAHSKSAFDIVEAPEYEALALPLMFRPLPGVPVVTQIHLCTRVNAFANDIPVGKTDQLADALELAGILAADAVCAATRSIVEVTKQLLPFRREVTIIPYPVEARVSGLPRPGDGPVLFVGRLQKRKGCEILASAATIFLKKHANARLHIAGGDTNTGPRGTSMQQEMIRRIDAHLRPRVTFLGELPQDQLAGEISGCRFQVIPSTVENFANTAIDAMAGCCPVVYAGGTGLDDVVGDAGLRAWPLTPENLAGQMEIAWTNPGLAGDLAARGLERIRNHFAIEQVTRQRIAFYQSVIAQKAAGDALRVFDRLGELTSMQVGCVLNALTTLLNATVGLPPTLATPGRHVKACLDELSGRLGRAPVVWLFGAGRYTLRLLAERFLWESQGLSIAGIIDEHPRFAGMTHYLGLRLRSLKAMHAALDGGEAVDALILSTDTLQEVFWERTGSLRDRGIATIKLV